MVRRRRLDYISVRSLPETLLPLVLKRSATMYSHESDSDGRGIHLWVVVANGLVLVTVEMIQDDFPLLEKKVF